MAEGNILPTPSNYAIEKPSPITVNAPLAAQVAAAGPRPSQSTYGQASNNSAQAQAVLAGAGQDNIRAMSAFSGTVQQKLAKMQEEGFADGYLRHMQGESIESIAKDNPFFGLFGDGGAVRGARAAQQQTQAAALLKWVGDNQGDLATMSADAQRKAVADYASTLGNTGDPESDALIAQGAMKLFPTIMDNLTRMGEAEQQRQAAVAQADSLTTVAQGLQYASGQAAIGQLAPEHYQALQAQALEAARPMPGQSPESYRAAMQGHIKTLTKNGQFEMANLIRAKVLDPMLTPEERDQLDQQQKQANASWLKDNPISLDYTQFTVTLPMQIEAGRYATADQMNADIDRFNADYKVQTGSMSPLINNEERAKYLARYQDWEQRQAEANSKLEAKAQDDETKRTIWLQGFAHGSPATMTASGLDSRQKAAYEQAETAKFLSEPGVQSASNLGKLAVNGYTVAPLKEKLSGTLGILKGGGLPKEQDVQALQTALLKFKNTPYGMGAAEAYFGDDLPLVLEMQNMDMTKRENVQYIRERAQQSKSVINPSQEIVKSANDLVDEQFKPGWWSRTFGDAQSIGLGLEANLKDDMKRQVANVMAQYPNMQEGDVMKMAAQRVRKGTTVMGNMLITGPGSSSLFSAINQHLDLKMQSPDDTRLNVAVNDAVRTKVDKRYDFTVGGVNAFPNGMMYVTVNRNDGNTQQMLLSAEDVAKLMNSNKAKQTKFDKSVREGLKYDAYGTNPGGRTAAYSK